MRRPEPKPPKAGEPLPRLAGKDLGGKPCDTRRLRRFPHVVFVFCGCTACADVARRWGVLRAARALPESAWTVVLYQGSPAEAKERMRLCSLVGERLQVLPDPAGALSDGVLHANPCPRAFVVPPKTGRLSYVSATEEKPEQIAEKALQMLTRR